MGNDFDRSFCIAGSGIIFRDFGVETIVANLDTGIFYSLGGSAPGIWSGLAAGYTGRQVSASFTTHGATDIAASIGEFLARLRTEGLLVPGEWPPVDPSRLSDPLDFDAPTIERFDDLQGLLLIDPIHDVSDAGWPLLPQTSTVG